MTKLTNETDRPVIVEAQDPRITYSWVPVSATVSVDTVGEGNPEAFALRLYDASCNLVMPLPSASDVGGVIVLHADGTVSTVPGPLQGTRADDEVMDSRAKSCEAAIPVEASPGSPSPIP